MKITGKMIRSQQLDAGESIFFARELEHIKSQEQEVDYPEMKARTLVPVSFEVDPADETITYYQYDKVGAAKIIRDYSQDLPRVDVTGMPFTAKVRSLGASFGYSIQEIRASKKIGRNLDRRRYLTAEEACRRLENTLVFSGDSTHNLPGFLGNANVSIVAVPADGAGASKAWEDKTADQILRDLNLMTNSIVELTKGIETPDTLLLPLSRFNIVKQRRIGVDSTMTVLKFFLETNGLIKNVDWLNELETAGAGGLRRMMAYKRDPSRVTMEVPQEFETFPPQEKGLEQVVPCHQRFGGVIFYKPLSAAYGDGI